MIVKAYCVIAVVNVKPIYFNKTHVLACFFTIIEEKYFIVKRMFIGSEIQEGLSCKNYFQLRTILKNMLKSLKNT